MDLYIHQMGGFDIDKAREIYGIPDDFEPVAAIAIGYMGDPEALPDDYRERESLPRGRRPMSSFVYSGEWGITPPFVK
jgi:hypothetical protein